MSNSKSNFYKLKKKIIIQGEIELLSGLHIGGSNNSLAIGGMDKMVIRNTMTNEPYLPGSSLKGKMRSLLELHYGYIVQKSMGSVKYVGADNLSLITTQLFGNAKGGDSTDQRPSRVIVRDGKLLNPEDLSNTEMLYTEGKTEVVIDRITSAAMPRQLERVPAGAKFALGIVVNIPEDSAQPVDEVEMIINVFSALAMVQDDYLGGNGSRGSGQVAFHIKEVYERGHDYYMNEQRKAEENKIDAYQHYMPSSLQKTQ